MNVSMKNQSQKTIHHTKNLKLKKYLKINPLLQRKEISKFNKLNNHVNSDEASEL